MIQNSNITLLHAWAYCIAFSLVSLFPLVPTAYCQHNAQGSTSDTQVSYSSLLPHGSPMSRGIKAQGHVMATCGLLPQLRHIQNAHPIPPSALFQHLPPCCHSTTSDMTPLYDPGAGSSFCLEYSAQRFPGLLLVLVQKSSSYWNRPWTFFSLSQLHLFQ